MDKEKTTEVAIRKYYAKISIIIIIYCFIMTLVFIDDLVLIAVSLIISTMLCFFLYRINIKNNGHKNSKKKNNDVSIYNSFCNNMIRDLSDRFKLQYLESNTPCDETKYIEIITCPWRGTPMFKSPHRSVFEAITLVIARVYRNVGESNLSGHSPRGAIIKGNLRVISTLEKVSIATFPLSYMEQCYLSLKALQNNQGSIIDDRDGFESGVLTTYVLAFESYIKNICKNGN
ncbi:hypothetical protein [Thalassotalea crassostreae]|uniref:hypothetical protein n=1 Tax=Thalassotalea crassostreae TaxID=1763536 RepID=UPI000839838B|nr:hypothetical protein [Thalassotalea crassostreae]